LELVQDLAGRNTAQAVKAIHFTFLSEKHPKVKAALLAGLGDMDADLAPETRLQLLTIALRGEARDVRSTALDLLSENDSPAATALLSQAMKSDPDREIRDAAAEYYRDRTTPGE
jgi:HEAT repeat protein